MKTKNEYIDSMATELKEWGTQIDFLSAKMEKSAGMMKLKFVEDLNTLHTKQQAAAEHMQRMENASEEAWEAARDTAEKIWDDLRSGVAVASSKFK